MPLPTLSVSLLGNVFINSRPLSDWAREAGSPHQVTPTTFMRNPGLGVRSFEEGLRLTGFIEGSVQRRGEGEEVNILARQVPLSLAPEGTFGRSFHTELSDASCLVLVSPQDYSSVILPGNWSPEAREAIGRMLQMTELYRPEALAAFTDLDNTLWAGDVAEVILDAAVIDFEGEGPIISWETAPVLPYFPRTDEDKTPLDYYNRLYRWNLAASYNYGAMMYTGLTLSEAHQAFLRAEKKGLLPKPYPELRTLINHLQEQGITVGFVSASPLFQIIPMLEKAGFHAPLTQIEGIDVYVTDPDDPEREVLLSKFILTRGIQSWDELLDGYGDRLRLTGHVNEVATVREGKSTAARAIVARHVKGWNDRHASSARPLMEADMRGVGVFGDNWGPFRDYPGEDPHQVGGDQGIIRAIPLVGGAVVFNLLRAVDRGDQIDYRAKEANYRNFLALRDQSRHLARGLSFVSQIGIAAGPSAGTFDSHNVSEII